MSTLSMDDVENIVYGATFLGTGGGGNMKTGLDLLHADLKNGIQFQLADIDELNESDIVASPYYVGAVGNTSKSLDSKDPALMAANILERYLKVKFKGIIAAELGGYATAGALHVAGSMGIPLVDADAAGRAVPDLQCSLFTVAKIPITPFSVYTSKEDEFIFKSISSDARAETIVRGISALTGSSVGICDHPTNARTLKNGCVRHTISKAMKIGRSLRSKSLDQLLEHTGISLIFKGKLADTKWEVREGFTYGDYILEGVNEFAGKTLKIWYKNENLMSWLDEKPYVTTPDLITLTTTELLPVTNPIEKTGSEYFVFGHRADEKWRTKEGMEVMSPNFFGFDYEYVPIEGVIKE